MKLIHCLPLGPYLTLRRNQYKKRKNKRFSQYQEMRSKVNQAGYSFEPFDTNRCIFVHVPKCAGISLCNALFGNLAGGHTTLDEYSYIFEPKNFMTYFKFTIVRNPWDRLVSAFHFLKAGGMNESDSQWAQQHLSTHKDFDSFVRNWLNSENIWLAHHFRPQYHYLTASNPKIKIDFIGRLETLDSDFEYICKRLGKKCDLGKQNASKRHGYRDYYSKATIDIVGKVYQKDVELLKYDF